MHVYTFATCICLCESLWVKRPSRKLLRMSAWSRSILRFCIATIAPDDLWLARRNVASLPWGQGGLPSRGNSSTAVALGRVVHHHHGGIHSGQRVHAALACWVQPRGAKFQLIVAGHLDEGAPTKRPLEASSKPGFTWMHRKEKVGGKSVIFLYFLLNVFFIKKLKIFYKARKVGSSAANKLYSSSPEAYKKVISDGCQCLCSDEKEVNWCGSGALYCEGIIFWMHWSCIHWYIKQPQRL